MRLHTGPKEPFLPPEPVLEHFSTSIKSCNPRGTSLVFVSSFWAQISFIMRFASLSIGLSC